MKVSANAIKNYWQVLRLLGTIPVQYYLCATTFIIDAIKFLALAGRNLVAANLRTFVKFAARYTKMSLKSRK